MRLIPFMMILLLAAGNAFADAKNPILEDPPGTVAQTIGTIVEDPSGKSYLASIPTICPVGTATIPVQVPEGLDMYALAGKQMLISLKVEEGGTYRVISVNPPPTPAAAAARIQPPVPSPAPAAMIGVLTIGFALGAVFIGLVWLVVSRLSREA
jgi:hypothetical protein